MADLSQIRVSGTLYDIKDAVARQATGAPAVAATVSDMTDRNKVYVYTGSESGYTSGNWYYFNGSSWVSGGVYNSAAVETDTSLSVSGAPADAKVTGDSIKYIVSVGDTVPSQHTQLLFSESTTELDLVTTETFNSEISDLRSEITNLESIPTEVKLAMDNMFANAVFKDYDSSSDYATFHAWATTVAVTSLSALYTQSKTVYNTASLDSLRTDLVVTAEYDDGTSSEVSSYTLSGELNVGTSTITVGYSGFTATFTVTVTENPLPTGYKMLEYVARPNNTPTTSGYNTTGFMPNGTDDLKVEMGIMLTKEPSNTTGYFLGCRQTNQNNTIGFGIYVTQDTLSLGSFDGQSAIISPNGGASIINQKIDVEVTKTSTGMTLTDGTNTDSVTGTPRAMASNLYVFAIYPYQGSNLQVPVYGRIYYLRIKENGVLKVEFIPCRQESDDAIGFYDTVSNAFKKSTAYVAGPEV